MTVDCDVRVARYIVHDQLHNFGGAFFNMFTLRIERILSGTGSTVIVQAESKSAVFFQFGAMVPDGKNPIA